MHTTSPAGLAESAAHTYDVRELVELERRRWPSMLAELAASAVPVAVEGDAGAGEAGKGEGAGEAGKGDEGAAGAGKGEAEGAGEAGKGDEPPPGWKPPTHAEWSAQQDAIAAANAQRRKAERTAESKETAGKKEAGKFEELYNDAEAKVGKITAAVSSTFVNAEVAAVAGRLGFRNPAHAASLISTDGLEADVDLEGDTPKIEVSQATKTMIERRLTELANTADGRYLIDEGRATQLGGAGGTGGTGSGSGSGGAGGHGDMNAAIRRAAGRA